MTATTVRIVISKEPCIKYIDHHCKQKSNYPDEDPMFWLECIHCKKIFDLKGNYIELEGKR